MKNTTSTSQFKLSVASSLLLFLSVMYGQRLWSELWMFFGLLQLGVIVFYVIVLIKGIVFWVKQKFNYKLPYVPFLISAIVLVLVIVLPLNWIRNWIGFKLKYECYEVAADQAMKGSPDTIRVFELPDKYKSLSVNAGKVRIFDKGHSKAVLFYTFTGVPDGLQGFVKVSKGKTIGYFIEDITGIVYDIKNLGNQWYYVSGK